jgi:hypothetical protein
MTNEQYFKGLRERYLKGESRDNIIKVIENDYMDGLYFEDYYDRIDYIVRIVNVWGLFN